MSNPLTLGRKALEARLRTITQANGYLTDAGLNVRAGWFNEVLQSDELTFPLIVLQKGKDLDPDPAGRGLKAFRGFMVIGAVDTADLDDYEDALDALELDLLRCLRPERGRPLPWAPAGVSNLTLGGPEQFPPGNGESVASVLLPVHLHTAILGN